MMTCSVAGGGGGQPIRLCTSLESWLWRRPGLQEGLLIRHLLAASREVCGPRPVSAPRPPGALLQVSKRHSSGQQRSVAWGDPSQLPPEGPGKLAGTGGQGPAGSSPRLPVGWLNGQCAKRAPHGLAEDILGKIIFSPTFSSLELQTQVTVLKTAFN